jgi:hypothetical protein
MGAVYVGRAMPRLGRLFVAAGSALGNPFRKGKDGTIAEVLAHYRAHVERQPELLAMLSGLRGRVLACWCLDDAEPLSRPVERMTCHAQVLALLAEQTAHHEEQR